MNRPLMEVKVEQGGKGARGKRTGKMFFFGNLEVDWEIGGLGDWDEILLIK
jgi:hypothetical protein